MEEVLQNFIDSLGTKYQAEADLHEEISRKIRNRLSSFIKAPDEYLYLEETILRHVEETYKRLLTTKRYFRTAKKLLALSHKTTQENLEKLLQIKTSVDKSKGVVGEQDSSLAILACEKKAPPQGHRPGRISRIAAPGAPGNTSAAVPFDFLPN